MEDVYTSFFHSEKRENCYADNLYSDAGDFFEDFLSLLLLSLSIVIEVFCSEMEGLYLQRF